MVLLRIEQILLNGDELCRVYNPDYLGDSDEKKKRKKKKKGSRKDGGRTHYTVDCHDFAEDDTVCGGHFSRLCFEEGTGVYADLMRFLVRIRGALTPPPRMDEPVTKMPLGGKTDDVR